MSDFLLEALCAKYVLDKTSTIGHFHEYCPGYESLLLNRRHKIRKILEIGIGCVERGQMGGVVPLGYRTGNSLRMWKEYLPNAKVYGMDIFPEAMFVEDRIKTYVADASNGDELDKCITDMINSDSSNSGLDIIIDDASHDPEHQKFTFMHLEKYLSSEGIYFIEDIAPPRNTEFINLSVFPQSFQDYLRANYNIYIFDTRHVRGRDDDVLMAFKKKPREHPVISIRENSTPFNDVPSDTLVNTSLEALVSTSEASDASDASDVYVNKEVRSQIAYTTLTGMLSEYYLYCVKLFDKVLRKNNIRKNFLFDIGVNTNHNYHFTNNRFERIVLQYEHTLVKVGGRSAENAVRGNVYDGSDFYLVRIDQPSEESLKKADIILEYSFLNMVNMVLSGFCREYLSKTIHIAPIVYTDHNELNIETTRRSLDVLTTFLNPYEPRRNTLINAFQQNQIMHQNRNDCFEIAYEINSWDDNCLNRKTVQLYQSAKILVNIHQTDHHHTLEEFRVLPALATGIIVISEPVPIKEVVPYHEFIVWSPIDEIVNKVKEILGNYNEFKKGYTIQNEKLQKILKHIHNSNEKNVENYLGVSH